MNTKKKLKIIFNFGKKRGTDKVLKLAICDIVDYFKNVEKQELKVEMTTFFDTVYPHVRFPTWFKLSGKRSYLCYFYKEKNWPNLKASVEDEYLTFNYKGSEAELKYIDLEMIHDTNFGGPHIK